MKRQPVIVATFLIAVFAATTIFAVVSTIQHPVALTEKSMAYAQHHDTSATNATKPTPTPTPTPTPEPYLPPPTPYTLTQ